MFDENEKTNLNMETNKTPKSLTQEQSDQEEKMTILSSLSIEQKSLQENQTRNFNNEIMKEESQEEEEEKTQQLTYYENLSDTEIKERICKNITTLDDLYLHIHIQQWLENDRTLFQFIRQHASLLAKYSSLKLELELYQDYMKMTEPLLSWLSTLSKTLFIRNNIQYEQFFQIQTYITKQLTSTEKEFRIITEKLAKSITDQQQQQISSSTTSGKVYIKLLTSLIVTLVQEDQQYLNIEFIKKRHLLMLNVKDISLVHEFYYLQPSFAQVSAVERIWEATINEQPTYKIITNKPQHRLDTFDYGKQIEFEKKFLSPLIITDEKGQNLIPMNYSQLNVDLLMNIIENRQQILRQRLAFQNDFNQLFITNHNHANDDDDDDTNIEEIGK